MFDEEEEVVGAPSFELRIRNGVPQVSGCYFIQPPIRAVSAEWDSERPDRIYVVADDGSAWVGEDVPRHGVANVVLSRVTEHRTSASFPPINC